MMAWNKLQLARGWLRRIEVQRWEMELVDGTERDPKAGESGCGLAWGGRHNIEGAPQGSRAGRDFGTPRLDSAASKISPKMSKVNIAEAILHHDGLHHGGERRAWGSGAHVAAVWLLEVTENDAALRIS